MSMTQIATLDGNSTNFGPSIIGQLVDNFKGQVIDREHATYDEARKIWNGMIDKKPALIAQCVDAEDVVNAVQFAKEHKLLVAIRGGGHNIAGNALCDGGLLIDLSQMKSVEVDAANKVAVVSPGATLGDVDAATQQHGLATSTGINSTTGIAGLTLGGGFGWLTRKYGMTIDNLIAVEVVTAAGERIRASETENADLFWGLRGGGGNFGIVTSFEFKLHQVGPDVWSGLVVFPFAEAKSVLQQYREFVKTAPEELSVWVVARKAPPLPFLPEDVHGTDILALAVLYTGDMAEGDRLTQPLAQFGTVLGNALSPHKFADFQAAFDPLLAPGARNYWKSHDFSEMNDEMIDFLINGVNNLPSPQCEIFFAHLGGAMKRVDPTATAYGGRGAEFVMNIHGRWDSASDDDACIGWSRSVFNNMTPHAIGSAYVNFMTEEEQNRVEDAYGVNHARLVELKNKYDPENMFRINQNIKPTT